MGAGGEWRKDDLAKRALSVIGDAVPEWTARTKEYFGGPVKTIAFCASVADCEVTAKRFQEAGHDFRVISYRQSAEEKQVIIDHFRQGQHIGLVSCVALTKGFDVPETRVMIDRYPIRKSLSRHIQKIGRVMRKAPGQRVWLDN